MIYFIFFMALVFSLTTIEDRICYFVDKPCLNDGSSYFGAILSCALWTLFYYLNSIG